MLQHSAEEHDFPQEIWLYIFRLATSAGKEQSAEVTTYRPFRPAEHTPGWWDQEASFNTKRAIVLVCKAWRVLTMEILYEEIRIRHSTRGLLEGLERSGQELGVDGYARWVRRIVIDPVFLDFDIFNPVGIPPILARCTSAEMIIRPITQSANPPLCRTRSDFPVLSTVKRVDWWLALAGPNKRKNPWSSDFLGQVLENAPNLRYLTISGNRMQAFITNIDLHQYPPHTLNLPSLKILHVDCDSRDPIFAGTTVVCPNLNCFVMGATFPVCLPLLKACGTQLRVIEISRRHHKLRSEDAQSIVKPTLDHCPNLEELYLYIDHPLPGSTIVSTRITHPKLKYIGLRAAAPHIFWDFIDHHSELFEEFSLPALECIGIDPGLAEWEILDTSRFPSLEENLRHRKCSLERIHGLRTRYPGVRSDE